MSETSEAMDLDAGQRGNPFSSRYIRPGAIEFRFAPGPKVRQLVERLRDTGCWGQIVGRHGSGKSTLVALLMAHTSQYGIHAESFSLHDGQRSMPRGWHTAVWEAFEPGRSTMVIVDGYEQLSRLSRWRLRHRCRMQRWGLLVTTHNCVGLPTLYRTATSIDLATALVESLVERGSIDITRDQIRDSFQRHHGNLRDVFFDLFDLYEQQRR